MTSVKLPKLLLGLLLVCSTLINAQTLTISDSGDTGTSGTNWSTSGTNPVIITATGNASVNTSVIEGYLNAGTSLLLEGSVINIASAIDKTAGGDATLTLRAGGTNTMSFGRAMINADVQSTSGALNIVLWSDYNNHNRAGSTVSGSPTINTNGGHFWVGGSASAQGSTTWNGLTVGDGPSVNAVGATNQNSVDIAGLVLNTGGGDTFIWAAPGAGNGTQGINFTTNTINAATGDIILVADVLNGASTLTSTGHLYLVPDGGAYPSVVTWSHNNASTNIDVSGTFDALTINAFSSLGGLIIGKYDGMTGASITNSSAVQVSSPIEIAGPITIEGSAVTVNHDIITSTASDITLSATNGFSSDTTTRRNITSANGNILIEADADASGAGTLDIDYLTFNAGAGDLTLRSELLQWLTTTNAIPWINGTGAFVLESNDASLGQLVETEWFNIDQDGNSYSELRLGKATNTQDININSAQAVAGPIAIYGEDIEINENLTSTLEAADILLKASRNVTHGNNVDITTDGGDIIYWSDSVDNNNGYIYFRNSGGQDLLTNGGDVIMAGGAGTTTPTGYANGSTSAAGINLPIGVTSAIINTSKTNAIGGDIILRGKTTGNFDGIYTQNVQFFGHNLTIDGQSPASSKYGVRLGSSNVYNGSNLSMVIDIDNDLTITAVNTAANYAGNALRTGSNPRIYADGDITINASGKLDYTSNQTFLNINPEKRLSVNFDGTANFTTSLGDPNASNTQGELVIQSYQQDSFTSAFSSSSWTFNSNLSGLTIGKSANTSDINLETVTSIAGPITVYGGDIAINENLNTTAGGANGAVLLKASGDIALAANKSITTNNGNLIVWSNSDGENENGSILLRDGSFVNTNGGHLWMGGGSGSTTWNDVTVGNGFAVSGTSINPSNGGSSTKAGVYLENFEANTSGGDISIFSKTYDFYAFVTHQDVILDSGSGKIFLEGITGIGGNRGGVTGLHDDSAVFKLSSSNSSTHAIEMVFDAELGSGHGATLAGEHNVIATNGGISFTSLGDTDSSDYGLRLGFSTSDKGILNFLSSTGTITIDLGANGYRAESNSNSSIHFGAKSGTDITSSSSNVVFNSDRFTIGSNPSTNALNFNTTGEILIAPSSSSFSEDLELDDQWNLSSYATSLTIGTISNTADVSLARDVEVSGPISIYGGNITLSENLSSTLSDADILLKATGNINLAANKDITTDGGDVTFWADSDGSGAGYNRLNTSSEITTGGGNITLGGGVDIATDFARGVGSINGIDLSDGSVLNAQGGDITLRGQNRGSTLGNVEAGLMGRGTTLDAGAGKITLHGVATGSGSNNSQGISINGDGWIIRSSNPDTDAIQITGDASGTSNPSNSLGINFLGTIESTGGGGILMTGKAGTASGADRPFQLRGAILANAGDIVLVAENDIATEDGIRFDASTALLGSTAGTNVTNSSSNIIIKSDNPRFISTTPINTSGTVSLLPLDASASFGVALNVNDKMQLSTSVSGLVIGKSGNTADVTIDEAQTINGPISVYGGDIEIDENLTATLAAADILLKASGKINITSNTAVLTNGGDLTLWSNTDNNGGAIKLNNGVVIDSRTTSDRANSLTSNATNGGTITLAGGDASSTLTSGTIVPTGYALKTTNTQIGGIQFGTSDNADISMSSGGGDIVLRGKSTIGDSSFSESNGILLYPGITIDAGSSGNVTIDGQAENGTYNAGVYTSFQIGSHSTNIRSANGDITLTGESLGGSNGGTDRGLILIGNNQSLTIEATGTGKVTLIGDAGTGANASHDIYTLNTVNMLAASGNITLEGRGNGSTELTNTFTMGRKSSTNVTSSSSDIAITDNLLAWGDSGILNINTTGTTNITPYGDDFSSNFSTSQAVFSTDVTGLTIGKIASSFDGSNDVDVTLSSNATAITGPITVYGGDLAINAATTATNSDINLYASGAVTQSAALTANRLSLNGTGTFTLQNTANNVGTIAGGDATTRLGSVAYRDANALEIGSINTDGIFSSGTILIETETENLTLSENINTTSNSDDAIILNAGKSAAAGTATGGDIIVSGTPTLTYGSGGRAKLFSGSASNSTGLTTLVGGDANVRTGVDETTVAFNPVLTDDNAYALYRNVNYTFDGTTWSPSDPNGVSTINSDIEIMSGNAVINTSTSCNTMLVHAGAGLTVNAAATLTVTNGLTLASNSTSYASLILDGTISGTMTYKRHVNAFTGSTGNDLIAPPLTGEAFNDFATANPNIYENPNDTNQKLFGPFDKTTGTYLNYNSTDTNTFSAGVGYRAARDASEDATHGTTFDFTGTAENASVAINIDNSGPQFEIWNLIGNPYPSYLDVQGFLNHEVASGITNIDLFASGSKAIYGYDGDASDGWTIYNLANTTANTLITPGQGFFVSADPTLVNTHNVEFTPAMRSTGTTDDFIAGRNSDLVYLKLNLSTNHNSYTTDFYFNANASEGLDEGYDASIWSGIPPSFSIYSQLVQDNTGQAIALQALHTSHLDDISIPLGVNANQGEAITFTISDYALPESVNVYLEDLALSTVTLLNTADYSIVPTTNVLGTGRFFLRFTTHNLSTPTNQRHNLNIYALNASKEILISGIVYDATSVEIYDIQGRKIRTRLLDANSTENRMDVSTFSPGIYVVCVKNDRTQVLTKKVILH